MIIAGVLAVLLVSSAQAASNGGLANNQGGFCQQGALSRCTDPLKVLTNNRDLGFATTKQELDSLCPRLLDGLECIDNFTSRCLDSQHREFFHMLYAGTKQVIVDLCQNDDYQREYLSHAPCMRVVQSGYEQCAIEYQSHIREHNGQNSLSTPLDDPMENSKSLCCSFQSYMKCSQSVVEETCGGSTATFTRGFLDTMAGPLIQGYCVSYEPGSDECDARGSHQRPSLYPKVSDRNDNMAADDGDDSSAVNKNQISGSSNPRQLTSVYAILLPLWLLSLLY